MELDEIREEKKASEERIKRAINAELKLLRKAIKIPVLDVRIWVSMGSKEVVEDVEINLGSI